MHAFQRTEPCEEPLRARWRQRIPSLPARRKRRFRRKRGRETPLIQAHEDSPASFLAFFPDLPEFWESEFVLSPARS